MLVRLRVKPKVLILSASAAEVSNVALAHFMEFIGTLQKSRFWWVKVRLKVLRLSLTLSMATSARAETGT